MRNDPKKLHTLLNSIEGVIWEADLGMQQLTFISSHVQHITGYSTEDWINRPGFWKKCIHQDDIDIFEEYAELKNRNIKSCTFEYRMIRADGEIIWVKDNVSLIKTDKGAAMLSGIMLDNTIAERLRALERLEHNVLKLNSDLSIPFKEVLLSYLRGLEAMFPQMQCSIHRIKNRRVVSGISPTLPASYLEKITGLQIGENEGSCGTAAATGQRVIVNEIANDIRWAKYRSLAFDYQLGACWSNPLIYSDGQVMATLAMYYQTPRSPSEDEIQVMDKATALLQIIMENRQKTEIINETNLLMLQSQELAHFGNWRWDIQRDVVSWSPALHLIFDLSKKDFNATCADYIAMLHPDDQNRVSGIFDKIMLTKEEIEFEERIIRPSGEIRYLRSWAKLITDARGAPLEMIGACLDITEKIIHMQAIEQQNQQLLEIAWVQSHAIRSPLTKIMALVELIKDASESEQERNELLKYLKDAADELDDQVKRITKKAKLETSSNNGIQQSLKY